ncbi:MAG TPA: FapA family protein [Dehalococcoidia bacterium]
MAMVEDSEVLEVHAASVEEGLRLGAEHFGAAPEDLDVRVVEERRAFLGLGRAYRLRITRRPPASDGRFELWLEGRRCQLTVTPPQGAGAAVKLTDVQGALDDWPLEGLDLRVVREAVEGATGRPVTVGYLRPPPGLPAGQPVFVTVTPDGMRAYAFPVPAEEEGAEERRPPLEPVTVQTVMAALERAGVVYGVSEEAVRRFVEEGPERQPACVARGVPVQHGTDARLEYLFHEPERTVRPDLAERAGRVDYREAFGVESVEAGTVLARKHPATEGRDGMTVLGQALTATPGKDLDVARYAGKGTEVGPDGATILAASAGLPSVTSGRVDVSPIYRVDGDVDFSTGNIEFHGSVVVTGNVLAGFRVHATDDIEIKGFVEAADVSAGGNVTIRGGVNGRETGRIVAGGDVHARFIEGAWVQAGGSVVADNELMRSHVVAGGSVIVNGAGTLSGGEVRAGRSVQVRNLGSDMGVATRVLVGPDAVPPELRPPAGEPRRAGDGDEPEGVVLVKGTAYPGTVITIRGSPYEVTLETVFARFSYNREAGRTTMTPLR